MTGYARCSYSGMTRTLDGPAYAGAMEGHAMRFLHNRALWFLATLLIVTPVLVAAHTETGRGLEVAILYSLVTAAAIGGLNAALLGSRKSPVAPSRPQR